MLVGCCARAAAARPAGRSVIWGSRTQRQSNPHGGARDRFAALGI